MRNAIDKTLAASLKAGRWLVLPIVLLLCLQWPLRDGIQGWSREANDLGQWLFALYVALSVTAATRARTHLAADMLARNYQPRTRLWLARAGALLGLIPWAVLVIITAKPAVIQSVSVLERFADTSNPFYFVIRLSVWIMAGFVFLQALLDLSHREAHA